MVNFNGTLTEEEYTISLHNRGLTYGDAVFETLRVSGKKIYFWEDHYFRLMSSMRVMRMEIPMEFTPEYLEEQVLKTVEAQEETKAYRTKIIVWRKEGGTYLPATNDVTFAILVAPLKDPFYILNDENYEVELFKDHYIPSGLLSTLKSAQKLPNILGSIFAQENGYANCLLLNEKKEVIEALNGNLFLVKDYKIKTAPLESGCLNGITRKQIIEILGTIPDYILDETPISPFELQKADEMFLTNVITGIQPITKYRKKTYGTTVAKELLGKLNAKARLG